MNCLKVSAFLHGFYRTGDMVDHTCLLPDESHALVLLSCGVHSTTTLPCYWLVLPYTKHNGSKSTIIRGVWVVFFSSFSGILFQVIQIKQRSHSQPWQKRVKICSTFVYLWRLTCCFCRKHHCSASRQTESQITFTSLVHCCICDSYILCLRTHF